MSNTLIADIGNSDVGGIGIDVDPIGNVGAVWAVINHVEIHDANTGIQVIGQFSMGTIDVVVQDTVVAGGWYGIYLWSIPVQTMSTVKVMMIRSTVANYWTGIYAGTGAAATIRLTRSTVTGNSFGWTSGFGPNVQSYGDNNIDDNGASESAPASVTMK